jgi:CheY-like chemotaxis protein/anti-sigma regulatory factor (Ser/Thr protein kinase)
MPRALIVDDAVLDRQIAQACVESCGWSSDTATNGQEALDHIERALPDAVLTDLQMPEMNGLELVKQVRRRYPRLPVILMTAFGSEDIAVEALRSGAVSFVPKKDLKQYLGEALRQVQAAVESVMQRDQVRQILVTSDTRFAFGYEPFGPQAVINYIQDSLSRVNFCDESAQMQIGMALSEAITNAIEHGNLELASALREAPNNEYRKEGERRAAAAPYSQRRVKILFSLTQTEATFSIGDEGPGFDPATLPDPTDPENLLRVSGRGILLIRTFMDDVRFNAQGNEIIMVKRRAA